MAISGALLIETADGSFTASAHGAHAWFTARAGGASAAPFDSFNIGPWNGDDPAAVVANHRLVEERASADGTPRRLRLARQVHEAAVLVHDERDHSESDPPEADAHGTARDDVVAGVLAADCVPVALLAPWGVGAVHAGWRGLAAGVIGETVCQLLGLGEGDHDPAEVIGLIGPCAGPCCYETGDEVREALATYGRGAATGRHADLPAVAAEQLRRAGVVHVETAGTCTMHDPRYFSHRSSGGTTGRQAGLVWRSA